MKRQLLALSLLASSTFGALGNPPPAMAASIYYETEPNNTDISATALPDFTSSTYTVQRWVRGSVTSGDTDFYRFNVTNSNFRLTLNFSKVTKPTGAFLYHDANRNGRHDPQEYVGSFGSTTGQITLAGMDSGRYFVRMSSAPSNYEFRIVVTPFRNQYEVESNNTHPQANKLTGPFLVGNRFLNGVVSSPFSQDKYDWYTFELINQRLNVYLSTDNSALRLDLYLDADDNGRLDTNEFIGGNYTDSSGLAAVTHNQPGYGKYFVRVLKPYSGSQFYTLSLGANR